VNRLVAAAVEIEEHCRRNGWRACVIGGLAVLRWGEPRTTQDVDITLLTGFGGEAPYVDSLLAAFAGRLPDARDFALRHRVVLLASRGGVPIDVALGAMPFEQRAVSRASVFEIEPGAPITTCGREDLIVLKAFAGREKDWLDIEGIVARQAGCIDTRLVWQELLPLLELKDAGDTRPRLERLLAESAR
jgi:hypothetical protein